LPGVGPGLVPQRPDDRVKTDPRDARKLARLLAGGLLEPIRVPSPAQEAARDLVRPRGRAAGSDARPAAPFVVLPAPGAEAADELLDRRSPQVALRAALPFAAQQITFDSYLHAVDLVDARIEQLSA
jgi:transposase